MAHTAAIERTRTAPASDHPVAATLSLLLALCPYVGAIAFIVAALNSADLSSVPKTYFMVATAASALAIVLAVVALRGRERHGTARWGLALAIIYLVSAGAIAAALTQL